MKFERFGKGIVKGMRVTLRNFFRKPITTQYPNEKLVQSKRMRGNELVWIPERCTGCATCAKCCPQGEIRIVTSRGDKNDYKVEKFEIDTGHCIFCGLCVEACPYDALYLSRKFECARPQREALKMGKERLTRTPESQLSAYCRPMLEPEMARQTLLVERTKEKK